MSITSNMGLTTWDIGTDQFDHSKLANNFVALDGHTHEPTKGVQIPSGGIADGSITSAKIFDGAVTTSKVLDINVVQAKLAKPSVGTPELFDASVTAAKIADGAITADKLDPASIPIGQCILWLRADVTVPIPSGFWEPLDGRAWSAVTNKMGAGGTQYNTGTMPDTRNAFVLGAATSGTGSGTGTPPAIGQAGGSHTYNLSHTHTVAGHTHTVPDHVHAMLDHTHAIAGDGSHNHGIYSRLTDTIAQDGGGASHLQTLYVAGFNSGGENSPIPSGGGHSHGGGTSGIASGSLNTFGSGAFATTSSGSSTDSQGSATQDIRPKFVGFLILCRVR